MNEQIENALRTLLKNRKDLFGENAKYLDFTTDTETPAKGFFSTVLCGRVVYENDGTTLSLPLAVKHTIAEEKLLEFYDVPSITNEVFFYNKIITFFEKHRPIQHLFPRFYGNVSENVDIFQNVSIMENLKTAGYVPTKLVPFLDYPHLALAMRKLAEFHFSSYYVKKVDPRRFRCLTSALADVQTAVAVAQSNHLPNLYGASVRYLSNDLQYASKVKNVEKLMKLITDSLFNASPENVDDPSLVIRHGDFAPYNMLFKYDDEKPVDVKFVDVGHCKLSSPAADLAYVLTMSANRETKQKYWDKLIDVYYTELSKGSTLAEIPTKQSILDAIPKHLAYPHNVAALLIPLLVLAESKKANLPTDDECDYQKLTEIGNLADPKYRLENLKDFLDRAVPEND